MIAVKENLPRFTPEEYFIWEEQQLIRHEYIDGEVYAMTSGTVTHSQIASNFNRLLGDHLGGSGCKTLNSATRVNILASSHYVYPDVSVTCDERDKTTTQYITYPCLVIEVLASSPETQDRSNKFKFYRRNPSLQEYVWVDVEKMAIEVFRKTDGGTWQIIDYEPGDVVELASVKLTFPIEQVYENVVFAPEKSVGC
jgi:Uma2 family endonuclease